VGGGGRGGGGSEGGVLQKFGGEKQRPTGKKSLRRSEFEEKEQGTTEQGEKKETHILIIQ